VTPVRASTVLTDRPPDATRSLGSVPSAEELAAWAQLDQPAVAPPALVVLAGRPDPAEIAAVVVALGLLAPASRPGAGRPGGRGQRASWPPPTFTGARSWSVGPVTAQPRGTDATPA
jgi:hypothetical protein